jgi:hypothetical protein
MEPLKFKDWEIWLRVRLRIRFASDTGLWSEGNEVFLYLLRETLCPALALTYMCGALTGTLLWV